MNRLNFPPYEFRFKNKENKILVFDPIRKKFVVLHPEEWVRQHVIRYLIDGKGYPKSLVNVERKLLVNGLEKRYDVVVFDTMGQVDVLVECKAPEVAITQKTFDQIARYDLSLNARYLMVTNGHGHYFCQLDRQAGGYVFLSDLPPYGV